jgi:hypothetical protein
MPSFTAVQEAVQEAVLDLEPNEKLAQRLKWSVASAILFIAVTPHLYSSLSSTLRTAAAARNVTLPGMDASDTPSVLDCKSALTHLGSAVVFFVANFLMMKIAMNYSKSGQTKSDLLLVKYSLYATLLYFAVSSADMYQVTNKIGLKTVRDDGCPSTVGVLLHAVVFALLSVSLMYLPKDE